MLRPGFTDEQRSALQAVARHLLANFKYEKDSDRFGLEDYWEDQSDRPLPLRGPLVGDCEQFAMMAQREANRLGLPARLIACWTETKDGHCITEVSSKDGKEAYYFDNRKRGLVTRTGLLGYRFYSASPWNPKPGETRPWVLLKT